MTTERRPSALASTLAVAGAATAWGVLRLVVYRETIFPLTYVLPLLLCVWTRRRWQLWSLAVLFVAMATWRLYWLEQNDLSTERDRLAFIATLANIFFGSGIVFVILQLRDRLDARTDETLRQNSELEAQSEELVRQNEEIRAQSEELMRQAGEIEAQTEELAQQNEDLQQTNALLTSREEVLQAVVDSSRVARRQGNPLEDVCRRTLTSIGAPGESIAVVERQGDVFRVLAQASLEGRSPLPGEWPAAHSLAALVMEERRTAYVDDFAARPDLSSPFRDAPQYRSALMTPLLAEGKPVGVVAVCAPSAAHWTQEQFRLLEWATAQCGLLFESRRWQQALEERTAALESASKAKDDFLATLSHELRTPLTPVLLMAEMLEEDDRLPADVVEDLRLIQRNIAVQSRLIDDLLDLTRIARGKIDLNLQMVCLATLLEECARIVTPDVQNAALKLGLQIDLPRPAMVMGDGARLHQVFWNLLRNSIKFSPPNSTITLIARPHGANGSGSAEITIIDAGPGISAEDIDRIFEPFEQAAGAASRPSKGGLGLGLSIARAITELHDGTIRAWPAGEGGGGRFTVRLPLAKPETSISEDNSSPSSSYSSDHSAAPLRILLVEDHEDTGSSLHRLLESRGYEVARARSCEEAISRWQGNSFDLLLSDLGLPDGTGIDLLLRLREISPCPHAVCMSGYGMESDISRTRIAGFHTHLIKPVRIDRLDGAIQSAVGRHA